MSRLPRVVDTNVPVAADGRAGARPECVLACVAAIRDLRWKGQLVVDDGWLIIGEYRNNLAASGQPGIGSAFLKWVLTNHLNPSVCTRVRITRKRSVAEDYDEFPDDPDLAAFDPADRKFVAVAAAHPERPPILQAVDTKWWGWKDALARNGVEVLFLCPDEIEERYRHARV